MKVKALFFKPFVYEDRKPSVQLLDKWYNFSHMRNVDFDNTEDRRKFAEEVQQWLERGGTVVTQPE